jgi:hypothetical protein
LGAGAGTPSHVPESDAAKQATSAVTSSGKKSSYNCDPLFVLDEGAQASEGFLAVAYDDRRFVIPKDKARAGRSYLVLDLVTQLLALNKSAKDLPATSVFTIVSPP